MSLWPLSKAWGKCKCKGNSHFPPRTDLKRFPWHLHLSWAAGHTLCCVHLLILQRWSLPVTRRENSAQTRVGPESQWAGTSHVRANSLFEIGPLCVLWCCVLCLIRVQSGKQKRNISHRMILYKKLGRWVWIRGTGPFGESVNKNL